MSITSLFKRKVRTILTVLGVVIGTTSIIVMLSLGIGMKEAMLEELQSYGSLTTIEVREPYSRDGSDDKKEMHLDDELVELFSHMEHVTSVSPQLEVMVYIRSGIYGTYTSVIGMTPQSMERMGMKLGDGEFPRSDSELAFVYGNQLLMQLENTKTHTYSYWEDGVLPNVNWMNDPVYVIFDTSGYQRAGQQDENGQIIAMPKKYLIPTSGVVAGGTDDYNSYSWNVYCNIEALKAALQREFKNSAIPGQPTRSNGKPYKEIFYNSIMVEVDDMENVTEVQALINDMGYQSYAEMEWLESSMQEMNIIQAVLGGIGAISLFVAAIGIANTMMMSIYERTKEIGIMKVIGCRIRDIQAMFLIEAAYIGVIGGVVGVGLSYALVAVINHFVTPDLLGYGNGSIARIPIWLCGISIVFAGLMAMLAGLFPSIRAMKLSPLAAIRSE